MKRINVFLILLISLVPAANAKEIPTSLAGNRLGNRVTLSKEGPYGTEEEAVYCPRKSDGFDAIYCDVTKKTSLLWQIGAIYKPEKIEGVAFEALVAARAKKYGSPLRRSTNGSDCAFDGRGSIQCAVWENGLVKMTVFMTTKSMKNFMNGGTFEQHFYGVALVSKSLREQNQREVSNSSNAAAARAKRASDQKAQELLKEE